MSLTAAIGEAQALEATEAGTLAAQQALGQIGRNPVALGFVVASHDFPTQPVLHGVSSILGEVPLIGFTSPATLTQNGQKQRSVGVALLAGSELEARAGWWPGSPDDTIVGADTHATTQKLLQDLHPDNPAGLLFVCGDGLGGSAARIAAQVCESLEGKAEERTGEPTLQIAGALAGGDLRRGRTFQIGGLQSGSGGIAAAYLTGRVSTAVGLNHGWSAVGAYFKITRANGLWLRTLDDRPASEAYSRMFGYRPREWGLPPLNELVRLYPLGVEEEVDSAESADGHSGPQFRHLVRAPLRMENDGSLRMNVPIPEGKTGFLLVGSESNCIEAARQAARQALSRLKALPGSPKPILAIVVVDVAWHMLFQANPGEEIRAVSDILGKNVPILGGYTFGQIARTGPRSEPELLNQQIEILLFGEPGN